MKFPFTEGTVMSVIQWKIRNGALATIATRGHLLTSTANVQLSEKKKNRKSTNAHLSEQMEMGSMSKFF
jgi:hypothetical protein